MWAFDKRTPCTQPQVALERTFTFRNSKQTWTGVPIMAANMVRTTQCCVLAMLY